MPARGRRKTDRFFYSLCFTVEGHLDLTWLFVFIMGLVGSFALVWEAINNGHVSVGGWAFLGSAFASVLIGAVPIAKARILASARMPGEVAKGIGESEAELFRPNEWKNESDPNAGII